MIIRYAMITLGTIIFYIGMFAGYVSADDSISGLDTLFLIVAFAVPHAIAFVAGYTWRDD